MTNSLKCRRTTQLAPEAFFRYQQANKFFDEDHQACARLRQFARFQGRLCRKPNPISRENLGFLRAVQAGAQRKPVIKAYSLAQKEAVDFLREVNAEIIQRWGISFTSYYVNRSTC